MLPFRCCRSLKLLRVFQRLLSAIAYWAPVAVECTFLPTLAFPFVKLLQNNQLLAFEVVATTLLNWSQRWFDFIPNPPLNILSLVENVLSYHDKELFQVRYGVCPGRPTPSLLEHVHAPSRIPAVIYDVALPILIHFNITITYTTLYTMSYIVRVVNGVIYSVPYEVINGLWSHTRV